MSQKQENIQINRLQKTIAGKLGWGNPNTWHSSTYQEMSELVFEETKVMLSSTTLKRFWGAVRHTGAPSINTLDTLSVFVGFENWRHFKSARKSKRFHIHQNVTGKSIYVTIGFFVALVSIVLLSNRGAPDSVNHPVTFTSQVLSRTYPNSVVFDFDLSGSTYQRARIQQYWDETKTIDLIPGQVQATGIYYFPGHYQAKLILDDQVISEHNLFLKSEGWVGTIDYEPVPKYFTPLETEEAFLSFPSSLRDEIHALNGPVVTRYHYINDLGPVSGDEFTLKTRLKNSWNDRWAVCEVALVYIIATDGVIIFPVSKKGCSSENWVMLNEQYLDGKQTDLSMFAAELSKGVNIDLKVENRQITLYFDNEERYKATYSETMGNLVGLKFSFLGYGEVQELELIDSSNQPVDLPI